MGRDKGPGVGQGDQRGNGSRNPGDGGALLNSLGAPAACQSRGLALAGPLISELAVALGVTEWKDWADWRGISEDRPRGLHEELDTGAEGEGRLSGLVSWLDSHNDGDPGEHRVASRGR